MKWAGLVMAVAACGSAPALGDGVGAVDAGGTSDVDAAAGIDDAAAPAPACIGKAAPPQDAILTMTWDGRDRTARVHVPASYDPGRATPLVINFHGYAMNAGWQAEVSHLEDKSEAAGFVVVHPEGLGVIQGWNAGDCCGNAAITEVDDVGYAAALMDQLERELCIDADRIFVSGFSNGGFLAHRLACELSQRVAAIVSVSGAMGIDDCHPTRPVPVLDLHGTSDLTVPYDGSVVLGFRSERATIDGWALRNGCDTATTTTFASGDARCERHTGCTLGADVDLCTLDGGGHQWPGGEAVIASGQVNQDIAATDALWSFFQAHPRP